MNRLVSTDMQRESCGIFGIFNHPQAAALAYLGIFALQHRGQESAGIAAAEGGVIRAHVGMGLASDVFHAEALARLRGRIAIGHVRYSTTGESSRRNAQPFVAECAGGPIAIAHNGNLTNSLSLRRRLEAEGSIFQTTMDSEIIVHLFARRREESFEERIAAALQEVRGSFSCVFLGPDRLVAARDRHGFRPLCVGRRRSAWVVASETCALDLIGARFVREVQAGEVLVVDGQGLRSLWPFPAARPARCIFEFIYFARPDSRVFGEEVYAVRRRLGAELAREHPAEADLVMPIPDSGNCAALGYAREIGLPFEMGFIRNHYVGRTFILPEQEQRDLNVRLKLNPIRSAVRGKRVVVVEDSVVRGTTGRARVLALRRAGAREIHLRVSCPPLRYPCFHGIDFPTREELIAARLSVPEIGRRLGVDSIAYLSLGGMLRAMPFPGDEFCLACFSGEYADGPEEQPHKRMLASKPPAGRQKQVWQAG